MDPLIENPQIISKYIIRTPQNRGIGGEKRVFWLKPHKLLANTSSELLKTVALAVKKSHLIENHKSLADISSELL